MGVKRKNKIRKAHAVLNLAAVKSATGIFRSKNSLFFLLSILIFFGLIIAAQFKVDRMAGSGRLRLAVTYQGDVRIGEGLSLKGRDFLVKNAITGLREPEVLKKIYGFYAGLPEVSRVHYVKRVFPDRMEVRVELRDPFVQVDDVYFDRSGCRLSPDFDLVARERQVPVISGLSYPRSLNPGDVWENIYFKEVLRSLEAVRDKIAVARVLVPSEGTSRGLNGIVLQTVEGALVCWGRVFNEDSGTGLGVESKVRNLDEALRVIAANMHKVKYVDISHEKPVIAY